MKIILSLIVSYVLLFLISLLLIFITSFFPSFVEIKLLELLSQIFNWGKNTFEIVILLIIFFTLWFMLSFLVYNFLNKSKYK